MNRALVLLTVSATQLIACVGTTGGELIEFEAFAKGADGSAEGAPISFRTGRGFDVELDKAVLRIGSLYLNQSVPSSVAGTTDCYLPGIYTAEVTSGREIDVLSSEPQRFPRTGFATNTFSPTGEVWLFWDDVNSVGEPGPIAEVRGVARGEGETFRFEASVSIQSNRLPPPTDDAHPGSHPICKERIVTPIDTDITPAPGGRLVVTVDPRPWFQNVDFTKLKKDESSSPVRYRITDDQSDIQSNSLFYGIRANSGVYHFEWAAGTTSGE